MAPRRVAVLGSTGSIGVNTLDVIRAHSDRLVATGLSSHSQVDRLCDQAREHSVAKLVVASESVRDQTAGKTWPSGSKLAFGPDALVALAQAEDVDVVVGAIVGVAGLPASLAAVEAGKTLALANKETLVVAGPLVTAAAARSGAAILPIDSEHSAVFQCLQAGRRQDVQKIVLTASGGPFRKLSREDMAAVTVEQALAHPTWQMGRKITIDSATMMNKGLEIIEARWLFDLKPEEIDVVIHPQSVVHSLVEFVDGALVAQLSPPDMRLPIQYALTYPERWNCPAPGLNWREHPKLEFEPPDWDRFPALPLCFEVARAGGTAGAVVNAANEAAVAAFLERRMRFDQIVPACRAALTTHTFDPRPNLADLLRLDRWARTEVEKWIAS